jgi:hypothetical protein
MVGVFYEPTYGSLQLLKGNIVCILALVQDANISVNICWYQ